MWMRLLLAVLVAGRAVQSVVSVKYVVVETKQGKIKGVREDNDYGLDQVTTQVDSYLGVPYGKAERFERAKYHPFWFDVKDALEPGPMCPQDPDPLYVPVRSPPSLNMSEECLYLNIFAPYQGSGANYPVMMYIHGGSYVDGSGANYDGSVLAQYGVVVVTINYRLGLLGFLSSGSDALPGNYGFTDQVLALQWIQENIEVFGGDPNKVTIFGNSAGGWFVGLHLLTQQSKGLFHGAIIQSAPILPVRFNRSVNTAAQSSSTFKEASTLLGCDHDSAEDRIMCIKEKSWEIIVDQTNMMWYEVRPTIDGDIIKKSLENLLEAGKVNRVPVIIGLTKHEEMRFLAAMELMGDKSVKNRDSFRKILTDSVYKWNHRVNVPEQVLDVIEFEYLDWANPDDPIRIREGLEQALTDKRMVVPTLRTATLLSAANIPTYLYQVHHPISMNLKNQPWKWWPWLGNYTYHESDLALVFGLPFTGKALVRVWHKGAYMNEDRVLSKHMMELWTQFAKEGKPMTTSVMKAQGVGNWEKYHPKHGNYIYLCYNNLTMARKLRAKSVRFWENLVPALQKKMGLLQDAEATRSQLRVYSAVLWFLVGVCGLLVTAVIILAVKLSQAKGVRQGESL
ncbi:cholinesterase 2-like [Lineus longissimus]|uniref:cholinesterase 2-like n=1 Tax=Lineus longissimus TaxID=88925 RepID=UPI002B4E6A59